MLLTAIGGFYTVLAVILTGGNCRRDFYVTHFDHLTVAGHHAVIKCVIVAVAVPEDVSQLYLVPAEVGVPLQGAVLTVKLVRVVDGSDAVVIYVWRKVFIFVRHAHNLVQRVFGTAGNQFAIFGMRKPQVGITGVEIFIIGFIIVFFGTNLPLQATDQFGVFQQG